MKLTDNLDRRNFILKSTALTTGFFGLSGLQSAESYALPTADDLYVIGPIAGFSPQIGTLVSMLNYNRQTIINTVKSLTMEQLDYQATTPDQLPHTRRICNYFFRFGNDK